MPTHVQKSSEELNGQIAWGMGCEGGKWKKSCSMLQYDMTYRNHMIKRKTNDAMGSDYTDSYEKLFPLSMTKCKIPIIVVGAKRIYVDKRLMEDERAGYIHNVCTWRLKVDFAASCNVSAHRLLSELFG